MTWLTSIWETIVMIWQYHWSIQVLFLLCVVMPLTNLSVRRNPHVIINGFMDFKKAKEIAPEVFGQADDKQPKA